MADVEHNNKDNELDVVAVESDHLNAGNNYYMHIIGSFCVLC